MDSRIQVQLEEGGGGEAQSRAEDGEVSFVACVPLAVARLTS